MLLLWAIVILQVVFVLFSPLFRSHSPFSWYYNNIYAPVFADPTKYKWKYWVVPLFYTAIYTYCTILFYTKVLQLIRPSLYILELYLLPFLLSTPLVFGCLTIVTPPYNSFTYHGPPFRFDKIIFHDGVRCRTCKAIKPARSRHCSICDVCVVLADHHCIWLNNCIGLGNYELFYMFLFSNCLVLSYATLRLPTAAPAGIWSSSNAFLSLYILVTCFTVVLISFSYTQIILLNDGMTTNEKDKWYVIHDNMRHDRLVRFKNCYYLRLPLSTAPQCFEFYSTNPYDPDIYAIQQHPYTVIKSHIDINNIYDQGSFWRNLRERRSI
ncbi:HBR040Wp [Eremothecium sinecaudum]|uniref:Palmitoyltransferase n=1 Tax=Eremothecium sinecaudum TaxID=45286 RepID=A0A109UWN5_9SACH|nr:HBR040Wp [Eremothecium sinecaudum]AMD18941.1 HBR040Wp [Eremothecium sinecaudum]